MNEHRKGVLALLGEKYGIPPELTGVTLEGLIGGFDLFEDVQLTQRSEGPCTLWLFRLRTVVKK